MKSWLIAVGLLFAAAGLSGCTHLTHRVAENADFNWNGAKKTILVVDPDVSLGEMTAGGVVEARADWSRNAKLYIARDVAHTLRAEGIVPLPLSTLANSHEVQIVKLHSAVGASILAHVVGSQKLPSKGDTMDWTLGPGTRELKKRYGANYALFIYVRDTYTSTARMFAMLGLAAIGIAAPGGSQAGFASLIDLRTGQIVWFNFLTSTTGDLRDPKSAKDVVANLLKGFPL